jgi:hypothetical protein
MTEATAAEGTETTGTPAEGTATEAPAEGTATEAGATLLGKAPAVEGEGTPAAGEEPAGEEGGKPAEGSDGDTDDTSQDGAPEAYVDFNMPDGVEMDKERLDAFKPMAKALDLSQEQAQQLIDFDNKRVQADKAASDEYYSNLMTEWQENVRNDKEIGGTAFDSSLSDAAKAMEAFGSPALYEVLEATGMGNHPEVIRVLARVGKAVKDDMIRTGGTAGAPAAKDPAKILFPNQN